MLVYRLDVSNFQISTKLNLILNFCDHMTGLINFKATTHQSLRSYPNKCVLIPAFKPFTDFHTFSISNVVH